MKKAGFPWSECQVRKLTTSHCTSSETIRGMGRVGKKIKTRVEMCTVAACRTAIRVRIGGDFFYGKSGNENHIKGI